MERKPLISVVTVCFNAADEIERTMLSVLGQTYPNIEYIIVDGGSADGTVDIIRKYAGRLAYWVSEPDGGIYEAMNKGIAAATGDYVNFMNAGDTFHDARVVETVFSHEYPDNCNVIYGKAQCTYRWGIYIRTPRIEILDICHQAAFIKLSTHKKMPFDVSFRILADRNFFNILYRQAPESFVYRPYIVSDYDGVCGVSATRKKEVVKEQNRIAGSQPALSKIVMAVKRAVYGILPAELQDRLKRRALARNPRFERVG